MKIDLKPIKNENEINLILDVYINSFPADERRSTDNLISELKNYLFRPNIVLSNDNVVGLFFYWEFDYFRYIEHFAVEKMWRGNEIGRTVLVNFLKKSNKTVVLEIERPENEISKKRLLFYESLGFVIIDKDYIQPPYEVGKNSVEMFLLSIPAVVDSALLNEIIISIRKNVYGKG